VQIHRSRLHVHNLEDRTTPASAVDLYASAIQMQATASFLAHVAQDFEWMDHPTARPIVQDFLTGVYEQSRDYYNQADGGPMAGVALFNMSFTSSIGDIFGFAVALPPDAPTTPPGPPADSGMTNTMPNINAPQWVLQQNGLKTWDIVTGTGDAVVAGDSITVFYTGWLASNGTVFDSRRSPADPVPFQLNNLIEGWKQGIPGMQNGGIRRLFVPAALGYGAAGSPPNVPPDADLVFEIKMISHS
jgi:hypothetical protein